MKTTLFALVAMMYSVISFSQSQTTTAEFNKNTVAAIETNIPFDVSLVEKAIAEKMAPFNVKPRDQKGYKAYRGVKIDSISPNELDIYFKSARKSKKEKDATVVTMLLSNGFEVFMTESANPDAFANAKIFLNSLLRTSAAADLDVQIDNQNEAVRKADKKLESLKDELTDLKRKLKQTEEKIADTEKEILKQEDLLKKEKDIQASLQTRREEHR